MAKATVTERTYEVLVRPVITEKSAQANESGRYTFEVAKGASKPEIKQAVEALYNVKVEGVNTLNREGKTKRFKGMMGRRSDVKMAVVKLASGQNLDVSAGL